MSITWNGVSSDTIGVIVERIPNRYVPTRRFSPQQVAGRNGNILLVDKAFPNVEQEYEVYLSAEAQGLPSVARACAEWLMGPDGYCRLTDSYDTTVYREAFLMGGYDLENILNKFGRCTITFSCKPQKYLLTGDTPIEIPAGVTTYTGDVVQFDGVTGASITSLSTTITPTQDLHGYANPWPAGGGKNLVGLNTSPNRVISYTGVSASDHTDDAVTLTSNGNATYAQMGLYYDLPAGTYTLSIKATSSDSFAPVVSGYKLAGNTLLFSSCKEGQPKSFTLSETAAVNFRFFATTSDSTARTVTFYDVQLESGSTATSWTPYSNICPISGRTGLSVYDDPKYGGTIEWNQLAKELSSTNWSKESGVTASYLDGVATLSSTTAYNGINCNSGKKAVAGHKYYMAYTAKSDSPVTVKVGYAASTGIQGSLVTAASFSTYESIRNCTNASSNNQQYVFCSSVYTDLQIKDIILIDLNAMFGSTIADYIYTLEQNTAGAGVAWFRNLFPKDYYPYNAGEQTCVSAVNGDPYWKKDIDWSAHGTVYGGTLDVVTGELTVTHESVNIDDLLFSYDPTNKYFKTGIEDRKVGNFAFFGSSALAISPTSIFGQMPNWSFVGGSSNKNVYIKCFDYTDPTAFKNALSGQTIVYELATPLTYQLTPQEIEVLVGENNVWTSSGPVSVTVEAPFVGTVTNPTPFEARPMLEVSGVGEITINGKSIQILESVSDFQIDCESMEAEDNSKIYCMDFPELSGGENEIAGDGSITALTVTPRWWTL